MNKHNRYLLCRPRGGLNDTFCRIELCWRYAQKFGRYLIIDTTKSSLFGHFDDFFEIVDNKIQVSPRLTPSLIQELNQMSCKPETLKGRLLEYDTTFVSGNGFVENNTKQASRFGSPRTNDFETDFHEQLLIYEDSGGGVESQDLFKKIQINMLVYEKIANAKSFLHTSYCAVHVRNTDYQTNYRRFFKKIKKIIANNPVLVCSDDPAVIEYGKIFFSGQVYFFNKRFDTQDSTGALHRAYSFSDKYAQQQVVIDSLIDLIGLANAKHLFISDVDKVVNASILRDYGQVVYKDCSGTISGFSSLAQFLCLNRDVLTKFSAGLTITSGEVGSGNVTVVRQVSLIKRLSRQVKIITNYILFVVKLMASWPKKP